MRGITRTLGALFAASALAAPVWAADITGLTPWACYEFNGSNANSGSGGRAWNSGTMSYTIGVSGAENTAATDFSAWTSTGNVSTTGGLTVSILATEGTAHNATENANYGHIFSLAADNSASAPQWWLRNTSTAGTLKLHGVFTEPLVITLPSDSTDTTFHHYVIAISGDRTSAAVYVDGVAVDTTGKTVNKADSGTGLNANFYGYQVGNRWGGQGSAPACAIDDLRIYTATLTPGQVAVLYGNLYANTTAYTRTVSTSTADWSATGAWTTGDTTADLPAAGSQATLTADVDTTLTLNGLASLSKLTLGGTGSVTVAEGTTGLGSATTVVNTTTDLSGVSAGLGALTIATDETLTVGDATITDIATGNTGSLVVKGNAIYSRTDMGEGNGIAKGRVITVTGANAVLALSNKDATGWGYTAGQKFVLTDGGTLKLGSRETFNTPLEMTKGHLVLVAADSGRAIDFFNTATQVDDITVSALDGATAEAPTVSTISSTGTGNARLMLLRDGDLRIEVAEKAKLEIDAEMTTTISDASGTRGKLVKLGDGVLELQGGASSIDTGTTVSAGTLVLAGNATLSNSAATTVEDGASLVIALDADTTRTIASEITGDGAVTVTGTGTAAFSTRPTAAVTVTGGATVKYFVTYDEATTGLTATNITIASGSAMLFELPNGSTIAASGEDGNTLAPQNFYTWAPTEDATWETLGNWKIGEISATALPGTSAIVEISVPAEGTTLTLGSAQTVATLRIAGEGPLTLAGETLTVTSQVDVSANTIAVKDKFLVGQVSQTEAGETQVTDGSIQIADGNSLTLSSETSFDPTSENNTNVDKLGGSHVLALPALTGSGTLIKDGAGALGLFGRSAEPSIQVKAGTLYVRETPTTKMALTAEAGARIHFAAWNTSFNNNLNTFALKGGSSFVLGNGPSQTIAGTMSISEADETSVKIYGAVFNQVTLATNISGTGTLEFADGETFPGKDEIYAYDKPVAVSGIISGALKVKVTDQANAVIFSGANTYTGGTDIASGSTVNISNVRALGTGAVTGAGTIATSVYPTSGITDNIAVSSIAGLTDSNWTGTLKFTTSVAQNDMNFALLGNAASTIEIPEGVTLSNYFSQGSWECPAAFKLNGGIVLNNGYSLNGNVRNVYAFTGAVTGSGSLSCNRSSGNAPEYVVKFGASSLSGFEGTLSTNASSLNLGILIGEGTYEAGKIVIASGASAKIASGKTWEAKNGTVVSGTIGGTGTVSGTLTFNAGATLDASAGALTAGTVSIADGVTVAVTLSESAAAGDTVLTCASPADVAAKLTGAPEGLKFAANSDATAVVLATAIVIPPVTEESGDVTLSEASQAVLLAKAQEAGLSEVTAVTGSTTVEGTATTLTAAQIDNALAVFGDSIVTAEGTTLKVDYNFGIVSITPTILGGEIQNFLVKVAVKTADGALATRADGVSIALVDGEGTPIDDVNGWKFHDLDSDGMYEAYFSANASSASTLIGRSFKVKATK